MADARQAFTVRLDSARYEWMRRQAYEQRVSMQSIVEEAIDLLMCTPAWSETMGDAENHPYFDSAETG